MLWYHFKAKANESEKYANPTEGLTTCHQQGRRANAPEKLKGWRHNQNAQVPFYSQMMQIWKISCLKQVEKEGQIN